MNKLSCQTHTPLVAQYGSPESKRARTPFRAHHAEEPVLKLECPQCGRTAPVRNFATTKHGLRITCSSCHARFFLEKAEPVEQPKRAETIQCPKCLRDVRASSVSCPKCGLVFALWEKGVADVSGAPPETRPYDPRAETLWRNVEAHPETEANHDAFVAHCRETLRLDLAALRYQAFLFHHPESRLARTYRDRIILLAQFNAQPVRRPRYIPRRFFGIKVVLIPGLAALLWGLVMAQMLLGR